MKYLKITFAAFAIALCLNLTGVNATQYFKIRGIKIPILSVDWTSKQADKGYDMNNNKIKKVACKDDVTGDGRALSGRVLRLTAPAGKTSYIELPQGSNVEFKNTDEMGAYKIQIKSNKSLVTTATADINWDVGSLLFPDEDQPYDVGGSY